MKFRYDINGLRAIAVLGVILYHFNVPFLLGGFAGVDVFFVISGYLMSKIILSGFEKSSFSVLEFYIKRIKRIIPALLVLVVFVLIIGSFLFFPNEQSLVSKNALSSVLFYSNIYYFLNSNYFAAAAKNNILLHTWSLSVEWQFYMLYPLILIPFKRVYLEKIKLFRFLIIIFLIVSFGFSIWITKDHPSFGFYFFPTRSWEMLIGCFVVLFEKRIIESFSKTVRNIVSILSYLTIIICFVLYNEDLSWPSFYTAVPILATTIILLCNTNFRILNNELFQFVGKISYSLYLWHWPLYVLAIYLGFFEVGYIIIVGVLTLLFSYLSYKYIEVNKRITSPLKVLIFTTITAVVALITININLNKVIIDPILSSLTDYQNEHENEIFEQMNTGKCFLVSSSSYDDFSNSECLTTQNDLKNVLLIGDSHAAHFSFSLRKEFNKRKLNLLQATTSGCYFFLNPKSKGIENKKLVNYILQEFIPNNAANLDLVIISANWVDRLGYSNDELKDNILELINYLEQFHLKVKIIGQTENYSSPFPSIAARQQRFSYIKNSDSFIERDSYKMNEYLKSIIPDNIYIDVFDIFDTKLFQNNIPYIFDNNHFTLKAADEVVCKAISKGLLDF